MLREKLDKINQYTFAECTNLSGNLKIPDLVEEIQTFAFYDCSNFTSLTTIKSNSFLGCTSMNGPLVIPEKIIILEEYAFGSCSSFKSLSLSLCIQLTKIEKSVFIKYSGITTVELGSNIVEIGDFAFQSCTNISTITFPPQIKQNGNYAFADCTKIASIFYLNDKNAIEFGEGIFSGCKGYKGVLTIPKMINSISSKSYEYSSCITNIIFHDQVTSIGSYAFQYCSGLKETLDFPSNIGNIEANAFQYCENITQVNLPKAININSEAFLFCT